MIREKSSHYDIFNLEITSNSKLPVAMSRQQLNEPKALREMSEIPRRAISEAKGCDEQSTAEQGEDTKCVLGQGKPEG